MYFNVPVICPLPDLLYFIILFRFLLFKVVLLCFDLLPLLLQCRNAVSLMHCYYACGVKQALQFIQKFQRVGHRQDSCRTCPCERVCFTQINHFFKFRVRLLSSLPDTVLIFSEVNSMNLLVITHHTGFKNIPQEVSERSFTLCMKQGCIYD